MKNLFVGIILTLALVSCRHDMNYSAVVTIDFTVPADSAVRSPKPQGSLRLIQEFDSMRQLLQSAELKDELRRVARLGSPYFSLSLEILSPSAPFTMTIKATSQSDLDKVIAALPGVIRGFAIDERSDFTNVIIKKQG